MNKYIEAEIGILKYYKTEDGKYLLSEEILRAVLETVYATGELNGFKDAAKMVEG